MADQPMAPAEAVAAEAPIWVPEEADALKNGIEHPVAAAPSTQDEAPLAKLAEPAAVASSDSERKAETNPVTILETTPSTQPIAQTEVHAEPDQENKKAAQAAFQEPELQTHLPPPHKRQQSRRLLTGWPKSSSNNTAKVEAELDSYKSKVSPNDGQDVSEIGNLSSPGESIVPPSVDSAPVQPPSSGMADDWNQEKERVEEKVIVSTEGELVKVNKLNKNHDGIEGPQKTNSDDDVDSRTQVLLQHHHYHSSGVRT